MEFETNLDKIDDTQGREKVFTRSEIITLATAPNYSLRDRALFTVLYLSNSRISEIVRRLRKEQVRRLKLNDKDVLIFSELYTEKNRKHPPRNVPVSIDKEMPLVEVIESYISTCPDGSILFPISRQRAYTIIKRMSGERCHYLRHTRLTHLLTEYNVPTEAVRRLAGWSDERMISTYSHLRWQDIAEMMV